MNNLKHTFRWVQARFQTSRPKEATEGDKWRLTVKKDRDCKQADRICALGHIEHENGEKYRIDSHCPFFNGDVPPRKRKGRFEIPCMSLTPIDKL